MKKDEVDELLTTLARLIKQLADLAELEAKAIRNLQDRMTLMEKFNCVNKN